jgi:hypothetical protein
MSIKTTTEKPLNNNENLSRNGEVHQRCPLEEHQMLDPATLHNIQQAFIRSAVNL